MLGLVNHKISKVVIIPVCDYDFVKKLLTFYPMEWIKMKRTGKECPDGEKSILKTFYLKIFFFSGNGFKSDGIGIQVKSQESPMNGGGYALYDLKCFTGHERTGNLVQNIQCG
jgi:hypothetical protein